MGLGGQWGHNFLQAEQCCCAQVSKTPSRRRPGQNRHAGKKHKEGGSRVDRFQMQRTWMWTRPRKKRQVRAAPFECKAQKLLRNSPQPSHTDIKSQMSLALETMVATSGANRFLGKEGGEGGREEERTLLCAGHSVSYATAICFNPHECPAKKALLSPSFRHKLRIRNSEELSLK